MTVPPSPPGSRSKPRPPGNKPQRMSAFEKARQEFLGSRSDLTPVVAPYAKKLVGSYWARQWCLALQSFDHYGHGLAGGRTLLRKEAVFNLEIEPDAARGEMVASATVWAGEPYEVMARFAPLEDSEGVAKELVAASLSLAKLLAGEIPRDLADLLADPQRGIMPAFDELNFSCTCPDYADLCVHAGALLYGLGVRLDDDPHLLFTLRGVNAGQLLDAGLAPGSVYNSEGDGDEGQDITELFTIDWDDDSAR